MFEFLKRRFKGAAIIETAITLPVVLYLIFASIEIARIGLAQVAVDSIARECSLALMKDGNTNNFDTIFNKYKPISINIGNFRYYISLYENINTMMAESPYGGETVGWAGSDYDNVALGSSPTAMAESNNYGLTDSHAILNKYQTKYASDIDAEHGTSRKDILNGSAPKKSGWTFVVTVAVKFPFSSNFVASLFNGGSNTNRENTFILWARGAGMINP